MKELWNRVRAAFENLTGRERLLVSVVGGLAGGAILYLGVVETVVGAREAAEQRVTTAEQQLRVMERLRRDFDDVRQRLTSVEERIRSGPRGNLRTTLESLAENSDVKVDSMEPQATPSNDRYRETKVEVELKEVPLAKAVNYLHQIESAPQVLSVKSLRMRSRKDDTQILDVTFTVSSFEPL